MMAHNLDKIKKSNKIKEGIKNKLKKIMTKAPTWNDVVVEENIDHGPELVNAHTDS